MKAEFKAINRRMNNTEEWIRDLEDRIMKIIQSGEQTENQVKNESDMKPMG